MPTGYFPGCSLHATAHEFDASLRLVADRLGLPIREIEDWNCCGASSAHAVSHELALALPARTLRLAAEQGLTSIVAPCAACFSRLAGAAIEMEDAGEREKVNALLDKPYEGGVRVQDVIGFLAGAGEARIREAVSRPLGGKKIACYYGCLLVRPKGIAGGDDPEDPSAMEGIIRAIGGEPVEWNFRTECCGGGFSLSRRDAVIDLSGRILADAKARGAEAVAVACPMCQSNLDMRQGRVEKTAGIALRLPVLYITQLIGLAFGIPAESLEIGKLFVDAAPFEASIGGTQPGGRS
ncbi:MAG: CoB--CoM heterodisulfide reductase iron-sulfur subunit B family protein [Planctomycetes bacterium]|nr:CoB--CoM heterodisulfide reductase iron-sulfur subunit B family protein [Planctomycetota bacterium]